MATGKRRMTGYVPLDLWHRFRAGCMRRQVSASAQLGALVRRQVEAWDLDDLGLPVHPTEEPPDVHTAADGC